MAIPLIAALGAKATVGAAAAAAGAKAAVTAGSAKALAARAAAGASSKALAARASAKALTSGKASKAAAARLATTKKKVAKGRSGTAANMGMAASTLGKGAIFAGLAGKKLYAVIAAVFSFLLLIMLM